MGAPEDRQEGSKLLITSQLFGNVNMLVLRGDQSSGIPVTPQRYHARHSRSSVRD